MTFKSNWFKLLLTTNINDKLISLNIMLTGNFNKLILTFALSASLIAAGCSKNGENKTESNTKMEHLTAFFEKAMESNVKIMTYADYYKKRIAERN